MSAESGIGTLIAPHEFEPKDGKFPSGRSVVGKRREEWLNQAREHHRAGRLEAAAARFRRVLQVDPADVDALIGLADVLESLGRNGEAISVLEDAVKRTPLSGPLQGRLADAFHAQGDLDRAVEAYGKAVEQEPALVGPWWGLGCALASLGDHASAVKSFRRLITLHPDHGMALLNLGRSLFELGQVDPALEAFLGSLKHLHEGARLSGARQHRRRHSRSASRGQPGHSRGKAGLGEKLPSAPCGPSVHRATRPCLGSSHSTGLRLRLLR